MILLDTDHVTLLKYSASERGALLRNRLDALPAEEVVGVTVVTIEEQMRGWLASIAKERSARRQVGAYRELASMFDFFAEFDIALFDERAADLFDTLRTAKLRAGELFSLLANRLPFFSGERDGFVGPCCGVIGATGSGSLGCVAAWAYLARLGDSRKIRIKL